MSRRQRAVWLIAIVAALASAATMAAYAAVGHLRRPVPARTSATLLTSGSGFGLSGSVGNLAPGLQATLTLTATNPGSTSITVTSVTISVTSVPPTCPLANLTLNSQAFAGSPPAVTVSGLATVVPANGSAQLGLPILVARSAPNGCQVVTFPFSYQGTATSAATGAGTSIWMYEIPNPSVLGTPVTLVGLVTGGAKPPRIPITGVVTFWLCTSPAQLPPGSPASECQSATMIGQPAEVGLAGQARTIATGLPAGSLTLYATFSPANPADFAASSSQTVIQLVVPGSAR
jgi:hypothetical protein